MNTRDNNNPDGERERGKNWAVEYIVCKAIINVMIYWWRTW